MYYIYVYFDPSRDLEPIYVGKGKGKRFENHLTRSDPHPFTYRLKKMSRNGIHPIIEQYDCDSEAAALALERELIVELGRKDLGTGPLLNLTDGGERGGNYSAETRAKMSIGNRGKVRTNAAKNNISVATKKAMSNPEIRAKTSAATKKAMSNPEVRAKVSKLTRDAMSNPEVRAKISNALQGRCWDTERRQRFSDIAFTDERREQLKEQVQCPHCGKTGTQLAMKRWHFDRCKHRAE